MFDNNEAGGKYTRRMNKQLEKDKKELMGILKDSQTTENEKTEALCEFVDKIPPNRNIDGSYSKINE